MAGEIAYFAIIVVIGSSDRNRRTRRTKSKTASKMGTDHVDCKPVISLRAHFPSTHPSVVSSVSQSAPRCEARFRKKRVPRGTYVYVYSRNIPRTLDSSSLPLFSSPLLPPPPPTTTVFLDERDGTSFPRRMS